MVADWQTKKYYLLFQFSEERRLSKQAIMLINFILIIVFIYLEKPLIVI